MTETTLPIEVLSPAEIRFERVRRRAGVFLAPLTFVGLLLLPMSGLSPEAHRLAAILGTVVVLWITEALPMPATALLGAALAVILGVAPARDAVLSIPWVGAHPSRILLAFGAVTAAMSAMSNTATAMMLAFASRRRGRRSPRSPIR